MNMMRNFSKEECGDLYYRFSGVVHVAAMTRGLKWLHGDLYSYERTPKGITHYQTYGGSGYYDFDALGIKDGIEAHVSKFRFENETLRDEWPAELNMCFGQGPLLYSNYVDWCPVCSNYRPREKWDYDKTRDLGFLRMYVDGQLNQQPIKVKRCMVCEKITIRSWQKLWAQRTRAYIRQTGWKDNESLAKIITGIWPEIGTDKAIIRKAIWRQAKKRAAIKPLTKAERMFFSMHLAASQLKKLTETNEQNKSDNTHQDQRNRGSHRARHRVLGESRRNNRIFA